MEPGLNDKITDELLIRFLYQEADEEEQRQVEEWLSLHDDNQHYLEQLRFLQQASKKVHTRATHNLDEEWLTFQQRIAAGGKPMVAGNTQKFRIAVRVAAALVVLCSLAAVLFYSNKDADLVVVKAGKQVLHTTLPDGSALTLNKGAVITYTGDYSKHRAVNLSGECFFDIAPDKKNPFVITANGIEVKVVGTSFNVRTDSGRTEVVVETGRVAVKDKGQVMELSPKEKCIAIPGTGLLTKETAPGGLYDYRTHTFTCKGSRLEELTAVLSTVYDCEIIIPDPSKRKMQLTATFQPRSLDEVLNIICNTLQLKAEKKGRQIILK